MSNSSSEPLELERSGMSLAGTVGTAGTLRRHEMISGPRPPGHSGDRRGPPAGAAASTTGQGDAGPSSSPQSSSVRGPEIGSESSGVPAVPAVPAVPVQEREQVCLQLGQLVQEYLHESAAIGLGDALALARHQRTFCMAAEFVQIDRLTARDALQLARELVRTCPVAACEAAYEDVIALWRRLQSST